MSPFPSMDPATLTADLRTQFDAFLDEHGRHCTTAWTG